MNDEIIIKKLDDHEKRLDKIIDKLSVHDSRLDRITDKLLEHDDKFAGLENERKQFRAEYLDGQDKMMRILIRLDEERVFTVEAIRRIQDEIDEQKKKINEHDVALSKIKLELKMA